MPFLDFHCLSLTSHSLNCLSFTFSLSPNSMGTALSQRFTGPSCLSSQVLQLPAAAAAAAGEAPLSKTPLPPRRPSRTASTGAVATVWPLVVRATGSLIVFVARPPPAAASRAAAALNSAGLCFVLCFARLCWEGLVLDELRLAVPPQTA